MQSQDHTDLTTDQSSRSRESTQGLISHIAASPAPSLLQQNIGNRIKLDEIDDIEQDGNESPAAADPQDVKFIFKLINGTERICILTQTQI